MLHVCDSPEASSRCPGQENVKFERGVLIMPSGPDARGKTYPQALIKEHYNLLEHAFVVLKLFERESQTLR